MSLSSFFYLLFLKHSGNIGETEEWRLSLDLKHEEDGTCRLLKTTGITEKLCVCVLGGGGGGKGLSMADKKLWVGGGG